ncbi:hypothetical protein COBT_001478 [Conglomerata obtusa]
MILTIHEDHQELEIIELQAEIENIEMMQFEFDKEKIELIFENFILKGKKLECELIIFESCDDLIINRGFIGHYYLFDKCPRFKVQ